MKNWFFLANESRHLPYELSTEIDPGNTGAVESALDLGYTHLERVLKFDSRPIYSPNDSDQCWYDLLAELESQSYFASISVPLLRQSLEKEGGYIFSRGHHGWEMDESGLKMKNPDKSQVVDAAHALSKKMQQLRQAKARIECLQDFRVWCENTLLAVLELVYLAITASRVHSQK